MPETKGVIALLSMLCLAGGAWGQTVPVDSSLISITSVSDAVGTGLTRYTYTAHSNDPTKLIAGFDMTFTTDDPVMNQINPAGNMSVFRDIFFYFPDFQELMEQDSQFLFSSFGVTIVPGSMSEGNMILGASFIFPEGGNPSPAQEITFAQIVLQNDTSPVHYSGNVVLVDVPEPTILGLLGLAGLGLARRQRRTG